MVDYCLSKAKHDPNTSARWLAYFAKSFPITVTALPMAAGEVTLAKENQYREK